MKTKKKELLQFAEKVGYYSESKQLYDLMDWLREEKQIYVEVGGIWNELTNFVESYCYTITAPVNIYYIEPVYASGGRSYEEMLFQGLIEALAILHNHNRQKHLKVSDDEIVVAYLKGYGDKEKRVQIPKYKTSLEKYAYLQGRQGDYIEEGLTEDDMVLLVRNIEPDKETLRMEQNE